MSFHHPDCDGWRMHVIEACETEYGTYRPACVLCGDLGIVGSAGSKKTALALAPEHPRSVQCAGECREWYIGARLLEHINGAQCGDCHGTGQLTDGVSDCPSCDGLGWAKAAA